MIPISARVSAAGVFRQLEATPAVLDKYLIPALDRAAEVVRRAAQAEAGRKTQTAVNANAIHVEPTSKYERTIATGTDYAVYLHGGRAPGKFPNMRPDSPFTQWVRQRFKIGDARQLDRSVYLIGRAIKQRGIPAFPFMDVAEEQTRDQASELLANAVLAAVEEINAGAYT